VSNYADSRFDNAGDVDIQACPAAGDPDRSLSDFDHLHPSSARLAHHVGSAWTAREGHDEIRVTFDEHPLVADRTGGEAVRDPLCWECLDGDDAQSREMSSEPIGSRSAAFDDRRDAGDRVEAGFE
jgi:hypothetical protein